MIAIVDYGMGNVRSIFNALRYAGCEATITAEPTDIRRADRIILPGVGAFGDAMSALHERKLVNVLDAEVNRGGKPMLGICLGMQLLARSSTEHGTHTGLGWLNANVDRFRLPPQFKIPHIGWNTLKCSLGDPLFRGLRSEELNFYFVHSFHMHCLDHEDVIATCDYGGEFTAAVRRGNIVATQFHPEKSQDNGVRVLRNFLDWNP